MFRLHNIGKVTMKFKGLRLFGLVITTQKALDDMNVCSSFDDEETKRVVKAWLDDQRRKREIGEIIEKKV